MLTDREIRALKPRDKGYEVADGKTKGLALRVLPSGTRTWAYRYRIGSRWRRISLGSYPAISLADARDLAEDKLLEVKKGGDPSKEKREAREAEDDTFKAVAARFVDIYALGPDIGPRQRKAKRGIPAGTLLDESGRAVDVWTFEPREGEPHRRSWKETRRMLRDDVPRSWNARPISEIGRRDVRRAIESKAVTAPIQANRLRALLHKLFAWALTRDLIEVNPATGTERPGKEKARQRVLSDEEVRAFWSATEVMDPPMRAWWRLRLVTAQRAGEVNTMRWSDLDLDNAVWTIPADRAKNGRSHRVPLSDMAVEAISELRHVDDYVLAGARGKRQQAEAASTIPLADFRGHDLRRTAASLMAGAGVPRLHISKVLNHAERGVTAVYDRHGYDGEKRMALDTLARRLGAILRRTENAEVVSIERGRS